jgi:hypothetical protein
MGVFERDIGTLFLLDIKNGNNTSEYWKQNRAISGKSPASSNDLDGIMYLPGGYKRKHDQ